MTSSNDEEKQKPNWKYEKIDEGRVKVTRPDGVEIICYVFSKETLDNVKAADGH